MAYGATIALVSGVYSLVSATTGSGMMGSNSGLLLTLLGVIVVIHGVVLLTPYASQLRKASGPLMIGYSLVMLLNRRSSASPEGTREDSACQEHVAEGRKHMAIHASYP